MKKISLLSLIMMLLVLTTNVYAKDNKLELCPNYPDDVDCVWISSSSHQANGENYSYAIVRESISVEISGTVTYKHLEFLDGTTMTLSGNGKIKFIDYGLSMTNIVSASEFDEALLKKYVKGDYSYKIEGDYVVLTVGSTTTTESANTTTTKATTTTTKMTTTSKVTTTETAEDEVTTTVQNESVEETTTTTTTEVEETTSTKKNKTKNIVILVGSLAIIGGCGIGIYFINKKIGNM